MRVDIVVNNHDYARYLPDALDSALSQTHPDTRVIVVDDGSSDDSPSVIAGYGDRVDAVLKPNGGQASAMNAGLARCSGDVVIFLDADDVLEPTAAAQVARSFAREPDAVRVHYRLRVVDADGAPTGEVKPEARLPVPRGDLRPSTLRYPFDLPWLPTSGNAFRREPLAAILPVPEDSYRLCADYYLVHVSSLLGPIAGIDEPLGRYRLHGSNGHTPGGAPTLDLRHLSKTLEYNRVTREHIALNARRLGLPYEAGHVASMCDIADRAIVGRVGGRLPARERLALARQGLRACRTRRDVTVPFKLAFAGWLTAMLLVPRRGARTVAELFAIPERRRVLNPLLAAFHRR